MTQNFLKAVISSKLLKMRTLGECLKFNLWFIVDSFDLMPMWSCSVTC